MKSCDVGSLPFSGDTKKFLEGASKFASSSSNRANEYFRSKVIKGFIDKTETGIDVPYYPQFRDMNEMFLEMFDNIVKMKEGYVETESLTLKAKRQYIPEAIVIKKNSREIHEKFGHPFEFGLCVTGPYTLSSRFVVRDSDIFLRLGRVISQLIENSVFNGKHGKVSMVAVDEPLFGFIDDPLIDFGSHGRENLRKAWEIIFRNSKSLSTETCLHLHSTADKLFWEVESLNVIESEMGNSLYQSRETKQYLESHDKFLKANVCIANFDRLVRENVFASYKQEVDESIINQEIAEKWKEILHGELDANAFLEDTALIKKRLVNMINRFGKERIPYAGPECGLRSFPSYESALECLRRVSKTVRKLQD